MRFVMIGGFLGAGKTTTIVRLARHYQQQGLSVGVVTNDQAQDLVDTHRVRAAGFEVGEVAGACFCCHFQDLTDTVQRLGTSARPDVVLAEPVGSCTDLVATVIQPLRHLHGDQYDIAPFAVLLKPSHGLRILRGSANAGFSPQAAYIFTKQLEEADLILINRIDELPADEVNELVQLIERDHPGVPVLRVSALNGQGFDELTDMLQQRGQFGRRILDIDYDRYAEGEAELGWLNANLHLAADSPFALDAFVLEVVDRLRQALAAVDAETAHLKVIGYAGDQHAVANLVSRDSPAELSMGSGIEAGEIDLIVNARVAIDPDSLDRVVRDVLDQVAHSRQARIDERQTRSFRPGRPVPTHRYNDPAPDQPTG